MLGRAVTAVFLLLLDCILIANLEVIEGHVLATGVLDTLFSHVDHTLVKTFVDFWSKTELIPNRLEHGELFVLATGDFVVKIARLVLKIL